MLPAGYQAQVEVQGSEPRLFAIRACRGGFEHLLDENAWDEFCQECKHENRQLGVVLRPLSIMGNRIRSSSSDGVPIGDSTLGLSHEVFRAVIVAVKRHDN